MQQDGWRLCTASNCCTTVHQRLSICLCASCVVIIHGASLLSGSPPHNTAAQPLSSNAPRTHSSTTTTRIQPVAANQRAACAPTHTRTPKEMLQRLTHTASAALHLPNCSPVQHASQTDKAYRQTEGHAVSHKFLHCVVGHLSPNCNRDCAARCVLCSWGQRHARAAQLRGAVPSLNQCCSGKACKPALQQQPALGHHHSMAHSCRQTYTQRSM